MNPLFEFGLSQEDANVEMAGLDLRDGDRLLCVASAGEVPLNILAEKDVAIRAVDVSLNQIRLSRLKMIASLAFDPPDAASFLGFTPAGGKRRLALLEQAAGLMDGAERSFWMDHADAVERGVISAGRFERYISPFSGVVLHLLGKRKVLRLMELESVSEREEFFDERIHVAALRRLFAFIFRPSRYRDRAVSGRGLQNAGAESKADFYFSRFRRFCTSAPARRNYFLQYFLFRRVLYPEALPAYLTEPGMLRIRERREGIAFENLSYRAALGRDRAHRYNKFHLSNLCDWMSPGDLEGLLEEIDRTSERPFRVFSRYLHTAHAIPASLLGRMSVAAGTEDLLLANDRFPFYRLVPIVSC